MRINEFITESQELDEGPIGSAVGAVGRGVGKAIGGVAKAAGAVAGVGQGVKKAFQKGKQASIATIGGDDEPAAAPAAAPAQAAPAGGVAGKIGQAVGDFKGAFNKAKAAASGAVAPDAEPSAAPAQPAAPAAAPAQAAQPAAEPAQAAPAQAAPAAQQPAQAAQQPAAKAATPYKTAQDAVSKLDKRGKQNILKLLQKEFPAAAPAEKPLTPAQSAKRRDQLGKEFKAAQNALQTTQDVLDSISFVKNEPGLSRATGFTGTLLPSFPEGAAASAETRLKNLEGKVTALGKAQAAATGAIGSIANQEWKILADQIAAIDRSKGTKPLLDQLELVEMQAQGAMERIRDAYQRQFGEDFERFPQFADLPTPKSSFKPKAPAGGGARNAPAGTGGGLTAAEQAELEQLRARFGKK